jgi:heme/flavin dehydrogenase (mycofactocin system)
MASTRAWFESVAEAQRRARRRLPRSVYTALIAGAEGGATLDDNVRAFREIGFLPHVATGIGAGRDMATTVLGQPISLPVLISPTGVLAVHPDAELGMARAAAAEGTAMSLSSFASRPVEEIVAANPVTFFQVYWYGSRERVAEILARAKAAGAKGIILTLDWTFAHRRDWGSPYIPERLDLRAMARLAPQVALRPRWLRDYARAGGPPKLIAPNLQRPDGPMPAFFDAYGEWMQTPAATWDDVAWLRGQWSGPLLIKGITRADDAIRAADVGADAISVSNHGGNNLDGTPASIRALPAVVEAVGDRMEIVLDGGIRRGSDVVKALALGARAVMIGRAGLWGMAAGGQAGVENVLQIMRSGIDETLVGLGRSSVHDLTPGDVVLPAGFERRPAA